MVDKYKQVFIPFHVAPPRLFILVRCGRFSLWFNILLLADGIAHLLHTLCMVPEGKQNKSHKTLLIRNGDSSTALMVHDTCYGLQDKNSADPKISWSLAQPVRLSWSLCLFSLNISGLASLYKSTSYWGRKV